MSVSSNSTDAVETVKELLDGFTGWTLATPEVFRHDEISQQEKENNPDPALYVWSPVDATFEQFSGDNEVLDEMRTVEIQHWNLDSASNAETYHQDVIDFLNDYADDNESQTTFHFIQPTSATDNRADKIVQRTDHYIFSVQVDVHNHRD